MPFCPITYEEISSGKYSRAGLRQLSRRLDDLADLPFTPEELRREALARASKMSIQGIQPKVSALLNVPAGRAAAGVEVPTHGMVYTSNGEFCYFIKRFDRTGGRGKRAVEDFAQLLGHTRDTKYDSSMEEVVKVIRKHCTFPAVDNLKLFRRVLVSFLCGNEDMHLKNFSLIIRDGKVELSPAYDFLNTTIVLANPKEELALPIAGKKSNVKPETLITNFALERLELTRKAVDGVLSDVKSARSEWNQLLERSFLTSELKDAYLDVLNERWRRMQL